MAQEPLKPFKGSIQPYKKVCVIESGVITDMYWEHPTGNDHFSVEDVIARWKELYPDREDFTDPSFLSNHAFARHNVIRDGVRPTQ